MNSDEKDSRRKLEEAELTARLAIRSANLGLYEVAIGGADTITTDKRFDEIFGLPAPYPKASLYGSHIHPDDQELRARVTEQALVTSQLDYRPRIVWSDGSVHWIRITGTVLSEDGVPYKLIGMAQDISDTMSVQQKMEANERYVSALVESAPFPIGVYRGKEMVIQLANQSIIDIWGKGPDVIGKRYADILPELAGQRIFEELEQVYTTGIPLHVRNQRLELNVNGRFITQYFNYSFTPVLDAKGNVEGVMNTAADVTDLNVSKLKLEQSEKNFRSMILQAPVAMCILLGPSFVIEVANDPMIELWGKKRENVMGKPVFDALPDAREQGLEQLMMDVFTTGEPFTANEMPVELVRNGNAETVYQNFVYEAYRDADGSILGILAISVDVSAQVIARHKIEEIVKVRTKALEEANASLVKSNSELEQFAYVASHDLQEPTRKMATYAQLLQNNLTSIDERSANHLDKIREAALRMQSLIRDVLAYSEVSKIGPSFTEVNLLAIVQEVIKDFELVIEQKKASLVIGDLPTIEAIPLQMSQLFGNLVSNSLKYSRDNVAPIINISARPATAEDIASFETPDPRIPFIRITVEDNGIGFDQQYADRIFHIFQRLHGKNSFEGTGIGLALCQKIVQNHDGVITAHSTENIGSTFTIILPAKRN